MGVYIETPEELSNHRFSLFSNPSFCPLFLVGVCGAAVGKCQQVRSCPGQCGLLPLPLTGGPELQQEVPGGGKGMKKCSGRMTKTLETLINSHFSLFAAFLLERQKDGRECDSWQMGCEDLNGKMGTVSSK